MNYLSFPGLNNPILTRITYAVCKMIGCSYKEVLSNSKKKEPSEGRRWVSYLANNVMDISHKDIANHLNISISGSEYLTKEVKYSMKFIKSDKDKFKSIMYNYSNLNKNHSNIT